MTYLTNNADHLHYHHALDNGWPIATGIIDRTCRHLVKDRMDITGARWGLPGAEAILKLRALTSNGDTGAGVGRYGPSQQLPALQVQGAVPSRVPCARSAQ